MIRRQRNWTNRWGPANPIRQPDGRRRTMQQLPPQMPTVKRQRWLKKRRRLPSKAPKENCSSRCHRVVARLAAARAALAVAPLGDSAVKPAAVVRLRAGEHPRVVVKLAAAWRDRKLAKPLPTPRSAG